MSSLDKLSLVRRCLNLCSRSYDERTLSIGDVECLVTGNEVAFRGTEVSKFVSGSGWLDVLRDIRAIPWFDKRVGWSHAGFLKGARAVVDNDLKYRLKKHKTVILTGHSLGGALAVNAGALLYAEGFKVKVVTFGSPRTFLKSYAKRWADLIDVTQYSNQGDPVCGVPFRWWGYRHLNELETTRPSQSYSLLGDHYLHAYHEALALEESGG